MEKEIKCLERDSKYFPENLKKLKDCPKELFVLGDERVLSEFSLSVIGSRKSSFIGRKIAEEICEDLSKLNVIIVSGFARGIDTVAHKTCINNKNKTIINMINITIFFNKRIIIRLFVFVLNGDGNHCLLQNHTTI